MLNKVILQGRLTKEPELKYTPSNTAVCSFCMAVDQYAKAGEEKKTNFIDCVAWRQTAEFLSNYFSKGSMLIADGHLQKRKWTDVDGNNRYTTEVVVEHIDFCGSKSDHAETQQPYAEKGFTEIEDDDIPF